MAGLADPWLDRPSWWLGCVLVGVMPLLLGVGIGTWLQQPLTGLGLFVLLLAAVRRDLPGRGMGALALGFGAHCAVAIALSAAVPEMASTAMPDGEGYWEAQVAWITTGTDPEYDWANWVPAHLHLLLGMTVLCFTSMGLLPLIEGLYEVDLMNFYVGNLLANSHSALPALLFGWHPWSVVRGLCYVVLVYEVASLSLQWVTGTQLSSPSARRQRWIAALALFLADGVIKISMLDLVRNRLAANLLELSP